MAFGSERSLLIRNPLKRQVVRLIGDTHFGRALRFQYLQKALDRLEFRPASILDAGCGKGYNVFYLSKRYPEATILGFDVSEVDLAEARQIQPLGSFENVTFQNHDLEKAFGVNKFDLVISWEALECIPNDDAVLENIYAALRAEGVLLLHVMHAVGAYQRVGARQTVALDVESWQGTGQVRAGYLEPELKEKLERVGFKNVELWLTFGKPGMILHSWFEVMRRWPSFLYVPVFPILNRLGTWDVQTVHSTGGAILVFASKE